MARTPEHTPTEHWCLLSPLWSLAPAVNARDIGERAPGWTGALIPERRMIDSHGGPACGTVLTASEPESKTLP